MSRQIPQFGFHPEQPRRQFLRSLVAGSAIFPGLLAELIASDASREGRGSHYLPKAKRVIFLFMSGGVSHVDTWDPKPRLTADHGKEVKFNHPETEQRPGYERLFLKRTDWKFAPHGRCGTEVSELFPHMSECVDDLALIRSMQTSHSNHYNATLGMHTGSFAFARPSMGAWLSYGLGTENRNLPSFIVIAPKTPYAGSQVWASDFLPAAHQGTLFVPGTEPIANISPRIPQTQQQRELAALSALNRNHMASRPGDSVLDARIRSFETAFGMQMEVPEVFDFKNESDATLRLYGLQPGQTTGFAWQCLAARRLIERGVRFVELIDTGSSGNWDSHGNMQEHVPLAKNVDQPIAGLLRDLKGRGLLEDTLVVWTSEFGRTPFNNTADNPGREHHNWAFSSWLAGAGIRPGIVHGETDEYGIRVARDPVHVHDFHATILHLMGLDHERLTFRHSGRDYRLTDLAGRVVEEVLA